MESHSHHHQQQLKSKRSNCGAMEEEDRLSSLPDDLLHAILRGLPLKQAARTSALSRRWAPQWLHALAASRVVDLTDRDFARGQPPERAAATVSRCLRLHAEHGGALDVLRVALACPPPSGAGAGPSDDGAFAREVIGWIAAAVRRGAREVEVDLLHLTPSQDGDDAEGGDDAQDGDDAEDGGDDAEDGDDDAAFLVELPGDLFEARNSLERLALGGLGLRFPAAGLAGLRSLSLSNAGVTDKAVRAILASCPALESLSLSSCALLMELSIASERLRNLELLACWAVRELRIATPALESFTLYSDVSWWREDGLFWIAPSSVDFDIGNMPALRDAYLSHIGCGHYDVAHNMSYPILLDVVVHTRILTLCFMGLQLLWHQAMDDNPYMEMPNLEELQLLLEPESLEPFSYRHSEEIEDQGPVSTFFMRTPLPVLQRLFLHLPSDPGYGWSSTGAWRDPDDDEAAAAQDMTLEQEFVLAQLTLIKVLNFMGTKRELPLLTFFLKRAPSLEQLVLVTPEREKAPADEELKAIQDRVSELQRSSREARISVCRPKEDDSPNHAHTRFFHEDDEYSLHVPIEARRRN